MGDHDAGAAADGARSEAIRMVVRSRPLTGAEQERGDQVAVRCGEDGCTVEVVEDTSAGSVVHQRGVSQKGVKYLLDRIVAPDAGQGAFFDQSGIKPLLLSALEGYAGTCFAYGQTGYGKTYSLIGAESIVDKLDQKSSESDGLLSRSVKFIFSEIKRRLGAAFEVEVCYAEIYQERVRDLLSASDAP